MRSNFVNGQLFFTTFKKWKTFVITVISTSSLALTTCCVSYFRAFDAFLGGRWGPFSVRGGQTGAACWSQGVTEGPGALGGPVASP